MKWLFKWAFRLALLLVVLLVGLGLSLDSIFKALIARQIRASTGMDVKIGKLSVGWLSPIVTMENFKLYNPAEFGGTPFLEIRELHLEYDRAALARRTLHVKLMRLELAELNVVKGDAGHTNILSLQPPAMPHSPRPEDWIFTGVDVLNLTVDTVRFVDLKHLSMNREFKPNLRNQVFKDVKTAPDLYGILMMIWLRSGGGFGKANRNLLPAGNWSETISIRDPASTTPAQTFTSNGSPFFPDNAKATWWLVALSIRTPLQSGKSFTSGWFVGSADGARVWDPQRAGSGGGGNFSSGTNAATAPQQRRQPFASATSDFGFEFLKASGFQA